MVTIVTITVTTVTAVCTAERRVFLTAVCTAERYVFITAVQTAERNVFFTAVQSKIKISSITNMANALMDPKYMQILKQFNARKYRSSQKKLRPHGKLISKLANPKVRYHEKRKTLQKAQVGEGLMNLAKTLIIPLMEAGSELLSKGQLKQFI